MIRLPISLAENARRGMVTVQIAMSMGVLMGMLALLVDGGLLLVERRHAQATADAAALAAASAIYTGSAGTASASATSVASDNGYTSTNSTVTVNNPPLSGNFTTAKIGAANSASYVEVIVTYNMQRGFSAIFGSGTIPVSARAVAQGSSQPNPLVSPAILLLGSTGTGNNGKTTNITDITNDGSNASVSVTGTTGAIYLDSINDPVTLNGSGSSVTAPNVYAADSSLSSKVVASPGTITLNAPQLADPLSYLPDPPSASNSGGVTVDSTYATSGITGSVTLNSNTIYIVGGNGINLSGQASVTGTNVMIYLTGSSAGVSLAGQASVNLTPLSTGTYAGMSLFEARDDSTAWQVTGNGTLNALGTIYAPAASVIASGNGGNVGSQIIASSLTLNGNGNTVAFSQLPGQIAATRELRLVE